MGNRQPQKPRSQEEPVGPSVMQAPPERINPINRVELAAAMNFLGLALGAASKYQTSGPDSGRASVVAALVGINQLIAVLFPDAPALPVPLIDLACALKDLDRGIVGPLLKPAKVSHRPPNALPDELFRSLPAAAMTLFMLGGRKREDAGQAVASDLNKAGYRDASGNRISPVQIAKWREKMMTERAVENLAVARYQLALEQVKGKDPDEAARFILDTMPALYPPQIPKKPAS
jgi:hypothetical protein